MELDEQLSRLILLINIVQEKGQIFVFLFIFYFCHTDKKRSLSVFFFVFLRKDLKEKVGRLNLLFSCAVGVRFFGIFQTNCRCCE
jgi:hypothetical protein